MCIMNTDALEIREKAKYIKKIKHQNLKLNKTYKFQYEIFKLKQYLGKFLFFEKLKDSVS
jgi:hypothetical protein